MDAKSIATLEFQKVLDRLSGYTSFSASAAMVRALRPTNDYTLAVERQARTTEARRLLGDHTDLSTGGARDVRPLAELAARGGVLKPEELLDIKSTIISCRDLLRFFTKLELEISHLRVIADGLEPPPGLIEAISGVISDKGEVLDNASAKLASLRMKVKSANDKVMSKLGRMLTESATARMLQEPLITMRNNRYVIPIKAEFKNRMRCVVQDQSASGATMFVEPLAVVDLNNRWAEAVLAETEEVRRILAEVSALVGSHTAGIQANVRALAALDFAFACAHYAEEIRAFEPILKEFSIEKNTEPDPVFKLIQARHPLLDPKTVVSIDIALEKGTRALVITGPNTGGKTVTLKTAGLLVLMAQSGLHIPAQSGSETCVFRDVFADIGDEQSIEQSLSTFSGHITNIVRVLKHAGRRSLLLMDELGAGTDPQEGSALARSILTFLLRRRAPCLIATHYPELKAFAHSMEGVRNASVEFDLKSLRPTYRLLIGIPGRSNALEIARRLGLDEEIIQDARSMINPSELQTEDLIDEIHLQLENARQARAEADQIRLEAENVKALLTEKLTAIDEERLKVLETAREQARQDLEELQARIESLRRETVAPDQTILKKKDLRRKAEELKEKLAAPLESEAPQNTRPRPLRAGDYVFVRSLKTDAVVLEVNENSVEVQVGKMRLKTDLRNITRSKTGEHAGGSGLEAEIYGSTHKVLFQPSPGIELHLRGLRAEEALSKLARYIDDAYAAGLPFVRIVHGKGTGTLRQLVRQALSESSLVSRWENAMDSEGGGGVTIAHLG
jgi:DNA mismatch repair protein MutS2